MNNALAGQLHREDKGASVGGGEPQAGHERTVALHALTRVLERQELLVVDRGCVDTYTLSHERAGDDIVVHLRRPAGARRVRVHSHGELSAAYRRIVIDLLSTARAAASTRPR